MDEFKMAPQVESSAGTLRIQKKISGRIHDFDLISLVRVLCHIGYAMEEIIFESDNSLCSQAGLIQQVRFLKDPTKQVIISLNMGLLSAQSPLPSYFQKNIDKSLMDVTAFYEFIGYFDHILMFQFLKSVYPELNLNPAFDLQSLKETTLGMLDIKCLTTLDWLFRLVFPELEVRVEKGLVLRQVTMVPLILGKAVLGENSVFGDQTKIMVSGRNVTLFSMDELSDLGKPWPKEIKERLKSHIFPILRNMGVDLQVSLVIESQKQWARLHTDTYLGYDKITGGTEQYKRIRIFKGHLSPN